MAIRPKYEKPPRARKRETGEFSPDTVDLIWGRDKGLCALCGQPVYGERGVFWSVHHRHPRQMGGTSSSWVGAAANGLLLHGHGTGGCHGVVERDRAKWMHAGFLVPSGRMVAADIPIRHAVHGWVLLDDAGGKTPILEATAYELLEVFGLLNREVS